MKTLLVFLVLNTWGGLALISSIPFIAFLSWIIWKLFPSSKKEIVVEKVSNNLDELENRKQIESIFFSDDKITKKQKRKRKNAQDKNPFNKKDNEPDFNRISQSSNQTFLTNSSLLR